MRTSLPELDAQYRILREEVAFLVRDDLALISASGTEAAEFLQGQLTNDVEALETGTGCYAALLDRKGKVQADARVLRTDEGSYLLIAEAAFAPHLLQHLSIYNIGRDASVSDQASLRVVTLAGPRSEQIVGVPLGPEESHTEVEIGKVPVRAVSSWIGADLIVAEADLDQLVETLRGNNVEGISPEALEIARVEAAIPRVGNEIDTATIPQEAGINERAVSFTKGCYIGQETVARLHYKGKPNRHLRRLVPVAPVANGDPITFEGKQVGTVGTAVVSPARGPLALAVLRREAEPGVEVVVGADVTATVEAVD
jgi:folate-binding protein YgfZ